MKKAFSNVLKGVREKKIRYAAKQLDFILKSIARKFDSSLSLESERRFALSNQKELSADFKAKKLRIAKAGCDYLSF